MVDTGHRIVIVGGGSAGITVAARLRRKGQQHVAVIEPAATHYYQPLWTLVGGGRAPVEATARPESTVMPKGVTWISSGCNWGLTPRPGRSRSTTGPRSSTTSWSARLACTGEDPAGACARPWDATNSSNYPHELAPATWRFIRELRSGTAAFTMPSGPAQARRRRSLTWLRTTGASRECSTRSTFTWRRPPGMFRVKVFADVLEQTARRYGITVHLQTEAVAAGSHARRGHPRRQRRRTT